MRRASTAQNRVGAAQDKVEDLEQQLGDVQAELDAESAAIRADWDARARAIERLPVPLERTDVKVSSIGLVWIPVGP
jgi:predicted  nucleic acid-binding Zn-ribbon protein